LSASGSDGSAHESGESGGTESAPPRRRRRIALPLAVVASVLVFAVFIVVTQTAGGRDAALSLLESAIARSVNGEVRIGHAISGNLLNDLTVSRFEIVDADGELFLALDTVTIEHDPVALLRQRLDVGRLHARGLDLRLRQYPDGRWNYDRVFEPPPQPEPPAPSVTASLLQGPQVSGAPDAALAILLHNATVAPRRTAVRTPRTETITGAPRA